MDTCRSYYLSYKQDDFAELDAETRQPDTTHIHYVVPANDNSPTKVKLSVRCRAASSPNCHAQRQLAKRRPMSNVVLSPYQDRKTHQGWVFAACAAQ
jgi:hypothetical protein